jgi:hypothetical protein
MLPFLRLHALAAARDDGLRPELRILFERLAEAPESTSHVAIADGRYRDADGWISEKHCNTRSPPICFEQCCDSPDGKD